VLSSVNDKIIKLIENYSNAMKNNCSGIQDWFASTGEGPGFAEY
jgi:hypothetical protein